VDPGIGFGKTLEHNLQLIRRLPEFASLICPSSWARPMGFIRRLVKPDGEKDISPSLPVVKPAPGRRERRCFSGATSCACMTWEHGRHGQGGGRDFE
jgi:hypothetical protein